MWCTQNFAIIANERVENIMVCDDYDIANQLAKSMCGENAIAIDVSHIGVEIGDAYRDGQFYKGDEVIKPFPTVEELINKLRGDTSNLEEAACDLDENIYQRLADIEEALCEIAEMQNKEA